MIQEILDYLLIRSLLYNSDSEELIDAVVEKENFIYVLDNIYALMQEEDFIFVAPNLVTNVSELLRKYRFDYNKDKELNDKINYIIGRLNDYRNMSDKRKKKIIDNWIYEESETRELPLCYRSLPNLLGFVCMDTAYFEGMISVNEPFDVGYVAEYISIINIILNKFPECFDEDNQFLEVTRQNLETLKNNKKINRIDSKMFKKTCKKIEIKYPLQGKGGFQKVIKKTEN